MLSYFTGCDNFDLLVAQEERSRNLLRINALGSTNVCIKYHGNPSSSFIQNDRPTFPRARLKTKTKRENQVSHSLKQHTRVTLKHLGFELVIYTEKHYHHCCTEWHNASIREYTVHIQEVCVCVFISHIFNKGFSICAHMLMVPNEEIPSSCKIITDIRSIASFMMRNWQWTTGIRIRKERKFQRAEKDSLYPCTSL